MITIVDYGVGNLFSLSCSLSYLGLDNRVSGNPEDLVTAGHIILPGVGAFADAARKLQESGMVPELLRQVALGKPLLGICLGMQLLFKKSYEYGEHAGLGLLPGAIYPLAPDLQKGMKVPHIGWNCLNFVRPADPLLLGIQEGDYVYYVHSYYAKDCGDALVATSPYGVDIPGIVRQGNVCGAQFHPEKSGAVGLEILRAFANERGPA